MHSDSNAADGELQFDRVERGPDAADASAGISCVSCNAKIETAYFNVGADPICMRCKSAIQAQIQPDLSMGAFWRALALGVVAAILGAAVYYGVIAATNLEIGIVAILIGYMVGWAVKKGAGGRGGRRFQVMAVALTYFSVGMAYFPMALGASDRKDDNSTVQTDSTAAAATPVSTADATKSSKASPSFLLGIAMLIGLTFALPVLVIIGSMPSGIISAIIILVGMRQAWQITSVPNIQITGPFRVGIRAPNTAI